MILSATDFFRFFFFKLWSNDPVARREKLSVWIHHNWLQLYSWRECELIECRMVLTVQTSSCGVFRASRRVRIHPSTLTNSLRSWFTETQRKSLKLVPRGLHYRTPQARPRTVFLSHAWRTIKYRNVRLGVWGSVLWGATNALNHINYPCNGVEPFLSPFSALAVRKGCLALFISWCRRRANIAIIRHFRRDYVGLLGRLGTPLFCTPLASFFIFA